MSYKEMYEMWMKWVEDANCKNMFIILGDRLREIEERLVELEEEEIKRLLKKDKMEAER